MTRYRSSGTLQFGGEHHRVRKAVQSGLVDKSDTDFRLARGFYYLGMSFVGAGALRPFGGLDISDWFFFASIAVAVATILLRRFRVGALLPGLFILGFAVFSLGALFSIAASPYPVDAAGALARFSYTTLVWFGLGSVVLRQRRHVEIAIAAWICSIAISGLAAIAQVAWGALVFASFTTISAGAEGIGFAGRQIGLSGHPNDLGGAAAIVIVPAIVFATVRIWTEPVRYGFVALLGLALTCIALSGSVTAFAAAAGVTAIWFGSGRAGLKPVIVVGAIVTLTTLALIALNDRGVSSVLSPSDRVSMTLGLTTTQLATGWDRLSLDTVAWSEIVNSPLFGVGLDTSSVAHRLGGVPVHNMFLLVWVGAGVFGAIGLVVMVLSIGTTYITEYRHSIAQIERTLVAALATSFVSFVIVSLAAPELFIRYGWVPVALVLPFRAKRLRERPDRI